MKKRILSAFLALCLVLTLTPLAALAVDEDTPLTALPSADENGLIRLEQDVNLENTYTVSGTITLDLNGHTITGPNKAKSNTISVPASASLTVQDNSESGSGTITHHTNQITADAYVIQNSGTTKIEGGHIEATHRTTVCNVGAGANLTVSGGTITSGWLIAIKNDDTGSPTLTITGGIVKNTASPMNQAVQNWSPSCTISDGEFFGKVVTWQYSTSVGKTVINGGTFHEDVLASTYKTGVDSNNAEKVTLDIAGGTFKKTVGILEVDESLRGEQAKNQTGTVTVSGANTNVATIKNIAKGEFTVENKATVENVENSGEGTIAIEKATVTGNITNSAAYAGAVTVKESIVAGKIENVGVVTDCTTDGVTKIPEAVNSNADLKVVKSGNTYGIPQVKLTGMNEGFVYLIRISGKPITTPDNNSVLLIVDCADGAEDFLFSTKFGNLVSVYEYSAEEVEANGKIEGATELTKLLDINPDTLADNG